jgi:hypothetical protein
VRNGTLPDKVKFEGQKHFGPPSGGPRLLTNPIILVGFVFVGEISVERFGMMEKVDIESQLIEIGG